MRWFWLGAVLLAVVFGNGCVVPESPKGKGVEPEVVPADRGVLVVKWQQDPQERGLLGSAWAAANADAYELVLLSPGGTQAYSLQLGSGQALAVVPGTYLVILLAGVKRTSGSSTVHLVGSGLAEGVVVTLGQRTSLDMTLRSANIGLSLASPAYWRGSLTVTTTGATRNSRVGMSLAGSSTTQRPRFKSLELWNGYKEVASVTGTPDAWSAEASGTVPDAIASLSIGLVGAGLLLQGLDSVWVPTTGITEYSWTWPNRADLADSHPLAPWSELLVPCGPPPTGLTVAVGWE